MFFGGWSGGGGTLEPCFVLHGPDNCLLVVPFFEVDLLGLQGSSLVIYMT
jgi:hypothetical protein